MTSTSPIETPYEEPFRHLNYRFDTPWRSCVENTTKFEPLTFNPEERVLFMKHLKLMFLLVALLSVSGIAHAGKTLDAIRARGYVQAGVNTGAPGFSMPDNQGKWHGLDVDIARAVAAALFNDSEKIRFTPLSTQQRIPALQSGEIDLLSRQTTLTLSRDTSMGIEFVSPVFYDGQSFMVRKDMGIKEIKELDGASICILPGSTTEMNVADYFRAHDITFKPVQIESREQLLKAFVSGRCDCLTNDASSLASQRTITGDPAAYMIFQEFLSKEPLAPAVRQGDPAWKNIVKWTIFALIEAEDLGITSKNVDTMLKSTNPRVKRFLGVTPGNGKSLGLSEDWACNMVRHVGNYGEVFERNLGKTTPLNLDRGLNALWKNGGLMYAPPFH